MTASFYDHGSQPKDACFTINRKKQYFHIYNIDKTFPLEMIKEYKTQHDMTYQNVANMLCLNETDGETLQ